VAIKELSEGFDKITLLSTEPLTRRPLEGIYVREVTFDVWKDRVETI